MRIIKGPLPEVPDFMRSMFGDSANALMTVCKPGHKDAGYLAVVDGGVVTVDDVQQLFEALGSSHTGVKKLFFSGVNFEPAAMQLLAATLATSTNIFWIRFEDVAAGLNPKLILDAVSANKFIMGVGFDNVGLSPAFEKAFIDAYAARGVAKHNIDVERKGSLFEVLTRGAPVSREDHELMVKGIMPWQMVRESSPKPRVAVVPTISASSLAVFSDGAKTVTSAAPKVVDKPTTTTPASTGPRATGP